MFGNWLKGVEKKDKARIRIGICAIMWAIWNCRNDVIFNKCSNVNFLQVIRMVTHWIQEWSYLLPEEQWVHMVTGCSRLEMVARDIYYLGGWRLTKRLDNA
jgi:hypothetical protein